MLIIFHAFMEFIVGIMKNSINAQRLKVPTDDRQ